jgi:hypothetical protein
MDVAEPLRYAVPIAGQAHEQLRHGGFRSLIGSYRLATTMAIVIASMFVMRAYRGRRSAETAPRPGRPEEDDESQ